MRRETYLSGSERKDQTRGVRPGLLGLLLISLTIMPMRVEAAPEAPAALIAVAGDGQVRLSWKPVPGASGYQVGRRGTDFLGDGKDAFTTIANGIRQTTYADTGLRNGTEYYYVVRSEGEAGMSPDSNRAKATPVSSPPAGAVKWPLRGTADKDADGIAFQYGPRRIGSSYNFHAGIDIPAPEGTPVHPVMDGVVAEITPWNGRRGPGNKVLVSHGEQKWTAYLHLNAFASDLELGQRVTAGKTVLGYVGKTGANTNHLHLTYMVGLPSETGDEAYSRNPLEILPHTPPDAIEISFGATSHDPIEIALPTQHMTVRWVIFEGSGQTQVIDYYQLVERGKRRRSIQRQLGMLLDATRPRSRLDTRGVFRLLVQPDPEEPFEVDRIVLKDFNGNVIADAVASN